VKIRRFGNFHSYGPHHNLKEVSVTLNSILICYSEEQGRFKAIAVSAAAWGPIFRGTQKVCCISDCISNIFSIHTFLY
jgi:hypothetical protein